MGNFLILVYYNLIEIQVTILTMYCVKEIENNYFQKYSWVFEVLFFPSIQKLTVKLN